MALVVCDFKRGSYTPTARLQTAAYELLLSAPDLETPEFTATRDGEDVHEYKVGGVVIPSVTQILDMFYPFPGKRDKFYSDRGTAVHETLQFYDEGTLEESSLCDETRGSLECYKEFLALYNPRPKPIAIEKKVASRILGVAGTIDRVFEMPQIDRPARLLLYIKPSEHPKPVWLPSNTDNDGDLKAFMGLLVNYHWAKKL